MSKPLLRPLRIIKRGFTSLFVCVVVLFPLFTFVQWTRDIRTDDPRPATPLAAMTVRTADRYQYSPLLFHEPLISVTFDDGWESIYTVAGPLLQKYGIRTTQYVLSGEAVEKNVGYMSWKQMEQMQAAGHELACHSINHPDLTSLDNEDLEKQLVQCKKTLSSRFGPIYDFASPYGHSDDRTITAIKRYYRSQRNTDGDISNGVTEADVNLAEGFNRFEITAVTVHRDTDVKQLKELVDYTVAHNGWLVLNYHSVDEGPSVYGLDPAILDTQLKYLSETKLPIVTMGEALEGIAPVKILPEY